MSFDPLSKILGIPKDKYSRNKEKQCPACGGSGSDESDEYSCRYCDGIGKIYIDELDEFGV